MPPTDVRSDADAARTGAPRLVPAAPGGRARTRNPAPGERVALRPASRADQSAVVALVAAAGLPTRGIDEQFGEQYAVAVDAAGTIVGVVGFEIHGSDALLRSAAVAEAWRGRGVGESLTRDRIETARARGVRTLWGLTTTAADYFVSRFGFRIADRREASSEIRRSAEFAALCPASATALALALRDDATG